MAKPVFQGPGEGRASDNPLGVELVFKVRGEQTDGALTAFENRVAPGEGPPMHKHANEDEAVYVLDGEVRFKLGDEIEAAAAGSYVFIPRGTPHAWQSVGDGAARMLSPFHAVGDGALLRRFRSPRGRPVPELSRRSVRRWAGSDVVGPPACEVRDPV